MKNTINKIKNFNFKYAFYSLYLGWRQTVVAYRMMHQTKWRPDNDYFLLDTTGVIDKRTEENKKKQEDACRCPTCATKHGQTRVQPSSPYLQ